MKVISPIIRLLIDIITLLLLLLVVLVVIQIFNFFGIDIVSWLMDKGEQILGGMGL